VFFYISGEGFPVFLFFYFLFSICDVFISFLSAACDGLPNNFVVEMAKYFSAMLVTLEHRYWTKKSVSTFLCLFLLLTHFCRFYGDSQPFDDLSTQNLMYLSTTQALADIANFLSYFKQSLSIPPGISHHFPLFIFQ
jgi:hypothetical protein